MALEVMVVPPAASGTPLKERENRPLILLVGLRPNKEKCFPYDYW